jgi:hypothetical protein
MNTVTKSSRSATHRGTCQKCGALQKLPAGRLSKHGYTTKWGFFSGVCNGSHELPYEQSCDLIKGYINWAYDEKLRLLTWAVELETPATEPKAWVHDYNVQSGRRYWRQAEIIIGPYGYAQYLGEDGKAKNAAGPFTKDVLGLASNLNRTRAYSIRREVAELDTYIKWQTERVTSWAPVELKPIKEVR